IWLPSVFLGVVANRATDIPAVKAKVEARATLAAEGPTLSAERRDQLRAEASGDDVILKLVEGYAPLWLTALLGAAVMAAVMASDSQILALSTMFTEDVFAFYAGTTRGRCRPGVCSSCWSRWSRTSWRWPPRNRSSTSPRSTRLPATRR